MAANVLHIDNPSAVLFRSGEESRKAVTVTTAMDTARIRKKNQQEYYRPQKLTRTRVNTHTHTTNFLPHHPR